MKLYKEYRDHDRTPGLSYGKRSINDRDHM
jgi:hypothetical protein